MAPDAGILIQLLAQYGYAIVFLAALAEAFPFLSILVPGQAIVIAAGAFAALGHLSIVWVILLAIPAGIIGDWAGYTLGRHYGRSILERYGPRFGVKERHLAKSDEMFDKYGPFALVLFRFSFLTRPVGPLLGGMSRVRPRVFWLWNVVGAVLWAVGYGLLGYFFGVAFLQLEGVIGRVLAWTVVAMIGIYVVYRVLKRYAAQFTRDDLFITLTGVASGAVFGIIADRVADNGTRNAIDAHARGIVETLDAFAPFFRVMEWIASFTTLAVVALALIAYLAYKRRVWEASLVGIGMGGVIVLTQLLQPAFAAASPPDASAGGFPSAFAAVSLVAGGVATFIVASHTRRARGPLAVALVGGVFSFLAAFARVAQDRELPSAALGGMMLGAAWLSLSILFVEFGLKRGEATH